MSRQKVRRRVAKREFRKAANRTNVKNIASKNGMMRGGFHF